MLASPSRLTVRFSFDGDIRPVPHRNEQDQQYRSEDQSKDH